MSAPKWMSKHPCTSCGTGYGMCAQGLASSFMCCKGCNHPGRSTPWPYTAAEFREMWEGHEMDAATRRALSRIVEHEQRMAEMSAPTR